jgi:hypothetical protein
MDATDYMELPEVKNVMISVELPPAARKIYDQMEDELIALLEGERVTAATAGVMSGKCRQIASGALYKSSTDPVTGETIRGQREWFDIHDAKLDALADLVDELQGTQLLVAYEYEHDLVRLQKRFPGTPYLGSGVSTKEAARIEREWNSGKLRLLFGHPASMGHGLNFQHSHAHHVAWFTTTWSFEQYEQFNARLRRRGNQSAHLFVYHLVARRTIEDGVVIPGLRAKEKGQRALFDALKAYAAARKA